MREPTSSTLASWSPPWRMFVGFRCAAMVGLLALGSGSAIPAPSAAKEDSGVVGLRYALQGAP